MEFYEEVKEEGSICTSESMKVPRVVQPVVIISRPKNNEDSKGVPWNYECNTIVPGTETAKDQGVSADPEPVKGKAIAVEQKRKVAEPVPSINEPRRISTEESIEETLENVHINAICEGTKEEESLSDICPYEPRSVVDNWTAEEIPEVFRIVSE
ncbi:hypothetical protein GOBAR_DD03434 [Gossypium barbadense]|nr:hypothetical protein GOBAR_DD03434 [Gossypium barbadense]